MRSPPPTPSPVVLPPPNPGPGVLVNNSPMHIHTALRFYNGSQLVPLPSNIGIEPSMWVNHSLDAYSLDGPTLSPLHTHDTSGTIHIESTVTRYYTLGEFFLVWDEDLGPVSTWTFHEGGTHGLWLTVDGVDGGMNWLDILLLDGRVIEIHYA